MTTEPMDTPWGALAGPQTRTPRALETRGTSERSKQWRPPDVLPEPRPRDGMVFKWCRTGIRNTADNATYSKRLHEGWEPVNAADHPEVASEVGHESNGHIERPGLILCKMPEEMVRQRADHYNRITREQNDSAEDHYMRDNDERVKKFNESTRKVFYERSAR